MKIIEAMKKAQDLQRKADDLRQKVGVHCADLTHETPLYEDTKSQVREWIQSHTDIVQEIMRLKVAVQRTNLATPVTIELGGKAVTKSIAEWIHRRRELAGLDSAMWGKLGDRGLKEGILQTSQGQTSEVKIRRYFDPAERDRMLEMYRSEPLTVDATLEVVNAVTDIIE